MGQRLTLEWDSIQIWGRRWPSKSVFPPYVGTKIVAWCWRKGADYQHVARLNHNNALQ